MVEAIVKELIGRHQPTGRVDLNDIAEVIGGRGVTYDEVEHIITRLEAEGLRVGEPLNAKDVGILRNVIVTAHRLREKLKRKPTIDEIALECGHPAFVVRRALEHGRGAARVQKSA